MADSGTYDPETIARHQKIADALLLQAAKPREIRSRLQGVGQLGEGLLAGIQSGQADKESKDARAAALAQALQAFGGGQQPTAAPAPMPAPIAAPQQTADNTVPIGTTQAVDASLPRGLRNNNPLNIEEGAFTQGQPGFSGSDGRFAKFQTPEQGIGAANALLDSYGRRGLNTPAGIVNRWAPSADGNNTPAYAMAIAKQLGIGPNDAIPPEMRPQLIAAMGQHENGRPIGDVAAALQAPPQAQGGPPPQQVAQNAPAPTAGPQGGGRAAAIAALLNPWTPPALASALGSQINPTYGFQTLPDGTVLRTDPKSGAVQPIYQSSKPTFGQIGEDEYGNKRYGFIDTAKSTATPFNPPPIPGQTGGQQATPGVTGEEYLKTLPQGRAETVKAIAEGREPFPTGQIMRTPYGQWLQSALSQYKPGLTAQDYQTIKRTREKYTSGAAADEIKAINTAVGHASKMFDVSEKMGGSDIAPGYVNPVIQGVKNNFPGVDPGFQESKKEYDALSETLATEVSKAINGGKPHVADKEHWRQVFSAADGPNQRRAAIKSAMEILEGRTTPLESGYSQGMLSASEPLQIFTPENKGRFERLLAGQNPNTKGEKPAEASPAAAAATPRAINPKTGEQIELRDGKWVPVK